MGFRSFLVGVAVGAGGFWAVSNGYHEPLMGMIKDKIGGENAEPVEIKTEDPPVVVETKPAAVVDRPVAIAEPTASLGTFSGEASYYAESLDGNPTASGEPYDHGDLTAAHRELPFGTRVRVTNRETGASVVVRINDRGPYADDRVIDVSGAAAERLGMIEAGVINVDVEVLSLG